MQILILTPGFPQDEQDTTCIPFLQDFVLGMSEHLGRPYQGDQLSVSVQRGKLYPA